MLPGEAVNPTCGARLPGRLVGSSLPGGMALGGPPRG